MQAVHGAYFVEDRSCTGSEWTDAAAEFIRARRRRGRAGRTFAEPTTGEVLELRRAALEAALVRTRGGA